MGEEKGRTMEREHYMQCPDCSEWFDMRDLSAVLDHEHWLPHKLHVSYSYSKKMGKENEVYVKAEDMILTLTEKPK